MPDAVSHFSEFLIKKCWLGSSGRLLFRVVNSSFYRDTKCLIWLNCNFEWNMTGTTCKCRLGPIVLNGHIWKAVLEKSQNIGMLTKWTQASHVRETHDKLFCRLVALRNWPVVKTLDMLRPKPYCHRKLWNWHLLYMHQCQYLIQYLQERFR